MVSFYSYENIEFLLKFKYHKFGHTIFNILARNSLFYFAKGIKEDFFIIPVDDRIKKGYSHTAILAKNMKTSYLTPLYSVLHSTNDISYAGKSLDFRLKNPRNFKYTGKEGIDVILVDDVLTTGTTLKEAKDVLKEHNVNVYLSVVLCDLKNNN